MLVDLAVELGVEFVAVVANQQQLLRSRWSARAVGAREDRSAPSAAKGFNVAIGICVFGRIDDAGQRIHHRHRQNSAAIVRGRESNRS